MVVLLRLEFLNTVFLPPALTTKCPFLAQQSNMLNSPTKAQGILYPIFKTPCHFFIRNSSCCSVRSKITDLGKSTSKHSKCISPIPAIPTGISPLPTTCAPSTCDKLTVTYCELGKRFTWAPIQRFTWL